MQTLPAANSSQVYARRSNFGVAAIATQIARNLSLIILFAVSCSVVAAQEVIKLSSAENIVIDLGQVNTANELNFHFSVLNDLGETWNLKQVNKSCSCQKAEVTAKALPGQSIEGRISIKPKKDMDALGNFASSVEVSGEYKSFKVSMRAKVISAFTHFPKDIAVPEGKGIVTITGQLDTKIAPKTDFVFNLSGSGVLSTTVRYEDEGSVTLLVDFDASLIKDENTSASLFLKVMLGPKLLQEEVIQIQLCQRTKFSPRVVVIEPNRKANVRLVMTSGMPGWQDGQLNGSIRVGSKDMIPIHLTLKKVSLTAAVVMAEIPEMENGDDSVLILSNEERKWRVNIPIEFSRSSLAKSNK